MTAAIANLALNVLMVALLAATIAYCWILNQRIKVLQDSKSELAQLLRHFDESTQRASDSIMALQTASRKIGENIQGRIEKANFMLDDLAFMIEKGNKLANQLEASLAVGRARSKVLAEQPAMPEPQEAAWEGDWQEEGLAEPLAEPLQANAVRSATSGHRQAEKQAGFRERTSASIGAMLDRINGKNAAPIAEEDVPAASPARTRTGRAAPEGTRPRSKVEQELLEIIRGGVKG